MSNTNPEDYSSIEDKIKWSLGVGGALIFLVLVMYVCNFNGNLTSQSEKWGQFGDYIGGTLNPILAALAFYWLTASIRLQIQEMRETKIELSKAAKAQSDSAIHQEEIAKLEDQNVKTQIEILDLNKDILNSQKIAAIAQQQQIAIQNFESLFFQLLKTKTDVTNDILVGSENSLKAHCKFKKEFSDNKIMRMIKGNNKIFGKEVIKDHLILFKTCVGSSWEDYYTDTFLDYAGSYFRLSYQIVKLIDDNKIIQQLDFIESKGYSKKQKEYFDIFRATFSQYELEGFFFNCLSKYGNTKFKKLLEKYGMFEPLLNDIDRTNECIHPLTNYAYRYDKSIFEKNKFWIEYFEEIENLKTVDFDKLLMEFSFCFDRKLILVKSDINPMSSTSYQMKFRDIMFKLNQNERFSFRNKLENQIIEFEEACRDCLDKNLIDKLNIEINMLKSIVYKDEIQFILSNRIDIVKFKDFISSV